MKKINFWEEDILNIIRNIFITMESETDDINRYLKKENVFDQISADDIFDALDNAIEICKKYNKNK